MGCCASAMEDKTWIYCGEWFQFWREGEESEIWVVCLWNGLLCKCYER